MLIEQKYFVDKSRPIYGIAVTGCFSEACPPVVYLYQQDSVGAKYLVDTIIEASNNTKKCYFGQEYYYPFHTQADNYSNPYSSPHEIVVPCVELYFETPQFAEDTIILSVYPNNITIKNGRIITPAEDQGVMFDIRDYVTQSPTTVYFYQNSQWMYHYASRYMHGMIHPIVELRCRGEAPVARVEEKGDGWARVSWPPDYVEEDYMVGVGRYGTEPADSLTFVVPRGDTSFTITGLENGYPYGVWVKKGCRYAPGGYDTVVWGDWGRYASLYLPPDTTGILAADESGELKVYPNPAHGVLTVDLSEVNDDVAELTLGDLGGREVLRTKAERPLTKVDVGALPAGLYLLQAASPGKVYRRRVAVE